VRGNLRLGERSAGNITLETGGRADLSKVVIGYEDGDSPQQSRLEVTQNAQLNAQDLTVGRGTGVVRVRSGGQVRLARTLVIGEMGGGSGEVQVEDTGSIVEAKFAVVGALGKGLLNTFSGGVAKIGRLTINNGIVRGNVQVGGSAPKNAALSAISADSLGLVITDTLIFNEGATIEADSITFAGGVLGGSGTFPFDVFNSGVISLQLRCHQSG
jgi:T5SS/PEP-CTERM-associated repeat protein